MITRERLRYLSVSVACVLLNNAIIIGATWSGLHYMASTILSMAILIVTAYLAHTFWTYRAKASWSAFGIFTAASLVNLPLAMVVMFVAIDLLHQSVVVATIATTIIAFVWNFLMTRFAITRRRFIPGWRD